MITYLILRHGSNASNQGMRAVAPVAIVEARSRVEAIATETPASPQLGDCAWLALDERVTVWANQWLEAVPVSRARASDVREVQEEDAIESLEAYRKRTSEEVAEIAKDVAADRAARDKADALHHGSHEFYGDISPCGACG